MADSGPGAVVGWLRAHATADGLAGCAFLIGPDIVLTCAHVIGAHLGLPKPVPKEPPTDPITIRFEALQDELTGHVVPGGWFSNARAARGELSDIAVLRLNQPNKAISPLPAIAQRMPNQSLPVLIHGAEADYKSYGQQVQGEMGGGPIPRGWWQINPKDSARGFTVASGFSGSPVLDDLGNVVWGMVVAVAGQASGVAYAIPAENLWAALQSAGADPTVRLPDATDRQAEAAMAKLREDYETRLAERESETARMRHELDQLRQAVRGLGQEARESANGQATTALDALTAGDKLPAAELLRQKMEERLAAAGEAHREAAAAARQLGTMLKLVDSAGALKAFHRAAECDPGDFWTWIEIDRLEQIVGDLDGARKAIDAALLIETAEERDRSVALVDLGDVQRAQGDLAAALTSYQATLDIISRLAEAAPGNAGWQRDLSVSHDRMGDAQRAQGDLAAALTSYRASLALRERQAKADPGNAGWQRDLSVSFNKVGDVRRAQGDLAAALTSYQASLDIISRLAEADLGNAGWQRDLSVSHDRIGDVRQAQGDLAAALTSFQQSLAIRERLVKADRVNAGWQRDLLVSHDKVGDVRQAQGDLAAALTSYQATLDIISRLTEAAPGNAGWQRDLSVSYDRIGDVRQAQGDLAAALTSFQQSLAIRERLVKADRGNAGWQRDLSVSHNKIGNVQQALGDLTAALTSYQATHDIISRLAKADPDNAGWQRNLSVSHENIGDVRQGQRDLAAALTSYQASLDIRERLAKEDPNNAGWQRDLAVSYARVATVEAQQGLWADALGKFRQGRDIISQLVTQSPSNATLPKDLAWFDSHIAAQEK